MKTYYVLIFAAPGDYHRGQKSVKSGQRLTDSTDIEETKFMVFEHRLKIDHYFMIMFIYCNLDVYSFPSLFFSRLVTVKPLNEENSNLDRLTYQVCLLSNVSEMSTVYN